MADKSSSVLLPAAYLGKEQAYVKHYLLEAYLEKLMMIVGMSARKLGIKELAFVDCFAGPWGDETESLDSTSIAISLHVLSRCRQGLLRNGVDLRFRALYIEKVHASFGRLKQFLNSRVADGIEAEALEGDFVDLVPSIVEWSRDSFGFYFIDPTAWRPVSIGVLKPLLERAQSEFLINFMYDFANRAASMADMRAQIEELLGEVPDIGNLEPAARERILVGTYRRNLKRLIPTQSEWRARSAYARVLDPVINRPKYHLVYLTTHPRGLFEFMEVLEDFDLVQKRVRAETMQRQREDRRRMQQLFDDADQVREEEGHVTLEQVEQYWRNRLSEEPRRIGYAEFADMLEETDWLPGDLQRALGNLIRNNLVRNLDAINPRRTKFVHLENGGERLQLVGEKQ